MRVDGTWIEERSSAYKLVAVRTASTIPVLYAAATPYRYNNRWVTPDDFSTDGTGPNRNAGTVWGTSASLSWDQSWGTLKSISAYRRLDINSNFDPDGSPLAVLDVFNHVQQHQLSQELQANGGFGNSRVHWVLGLYYFRETAQDDQPANVGLEYFHGAANFNPQLHVINQNLAAYGQATADLTPQLKLTLGARAGQDRAQVGRVQVDYPIPTVEQPFVSRSASWTSVLPRVSLDYQLTPDLMTYVSAAEGNKSGGFNGRAGSIAEFNGFDPEKVWTYEWGVRSDWADRRLRFNATAFYSVYRDFQILLNSSVTDPTTGNPVPFSFVGNIPKAAIKGGGNCAHVDGDRRQRIVRVLDQSRRCRNSSPDDVVVGWHSHNLLERAGEMIRREPGDGGEPIIMGRARSRSMWSQTRRLTPGASPRAVEPQVLDCSAAAPVRHVRLHPR